MINKDYSVLRELAKEVAEVASLPIHKRKIDMWKRLNSLKKVRPLIWINEIPWHEMDINNELKNQCEDDFCRQYEVYLRRILYQWKHMRADMIIEPKIFYPLAITDTGFGITQDVDIVKTDETSNIISRSFHPQINSEKDIEKIKYPKIYFDEKASNLNYEKTHEIFDEILTIEKMGPSEEGVAGFWFAPWDYLIQWWGVEQAMIDMMQRPKLVHQAMERFVNANISRLEQYERMNLLTLNNGNFRIGSGGLGYTDELPKSDFDSKHVRTIDLWGNSAAQIFSGISPAMHEEFSLQYEIRWLSKFGLNYYGCCEPLDKKISILKKIPNLRKISMSPWVNLENAASNVQDRYVFSWKPSPAIFSSDSWDIDLIKKNLKRDLKKIRGCIIEIIMKDISTVRYKPQRLWDWEKIAIEAVEEFGSH